MILRRLNNKGIEEFCSYLDACDSDDPQPYPEYLLVSEEFSENVTPDIKMDRKYFGTRYEAAKYLLSKINGKGIPNIEYDKGLWTWLALYYFEHICEKDKSGSFHPGNINRWVLCSDYKTYYRHLLAGPFRIYRAYQADPDIAYVLLATPVGKPGEVVEQLASRQLIVSNRRIIEAATEIYVDKKDMTIKTGAAGKGKGSARRYADLMMQLDVTWDLFSMFPEEILALLPAEFDRFVD